MIYKKSGQEFECEQLTAPKTIIVKNTLRVGRQGQWFVKPKGASTQEPNDGIPIVPGAYFEDAHFFERDFVKL